MKVNDTDPRVSAMAEDWRLIETLLGGTKAVRAAGERYLPRYSLETEQDYKARLNTATLFPALAQTIRELTGRVFGETIALDDDAPEWIRGDVWPDIDRQGASGHVFARAWWREGLALGLCHVLVEAPQVVARSQAEQRQAGARPYCILLTPKRVLGWKHAPDGSLAQLRITWSRTEPGEFGDTTVPQIRVYDTVPGGTVIVREFEERKAAKGNEKEWVQVGQIATGVTSIPLATFYTGKTAPMCAEPPLRELAHLNAKHWALQASADALLQVASVPLLAVIGVNEDAQTIPVGSKAALNLPPGGDAKWVEHSGKAIESGRAQISDLEDQMKAIGAKLIEPGGATKTATQAGEEAASANSVLAGWVQDFADSMAALLDVIAGYRDDETGGKVKLHADLDPDSAPVESMQVLSKMRAQGDLSRATLFAEAQRRGLVSSETTWDDEQERIAMEGPEPEPEPNPQPGAVNA